MYHAHINILGTGYDIMLLQWLALWMGKMNQILHCDWDYLGTTCRVLQENSPISRNFIIYNKPFIDQACLVKMAEYWHHSFLRV